MSSNTRTAAVAAAVVLVAAGAMGQALTPMEQLGKSIFFDLSLSINQNQSCASCHAPEVGFTGPITSINEHGSVYEGSIPGRFGNRKPPSAAYATPSPIFHFEKGLWIGGNFWDGRATGWRLGNPAADQALGPFLNPAEQALPDSACVVYRVCNPVVPGDYPVSFEDVWGPDECDIAWPPDVEVVCASENTTVALSSEDDSLSDMNYDRIGLTIAAYEGSPEVNRFSAKIDLQGPDGVLNELERRGRALFNGKGQCRRCHPGNGQQPLFTDFSFDNLGLPKNPENPVGMEFVDPGLGGFLNSLEYPEEVWEPELGKHKVPTLRNVAKGADAGFVKAYGHNGYFKSLWGIVHFYNTRDVLEECPDGYTEAQALAADCWPPPEVEENVNDSELGDLGLSYDEELAIVEYLKALSDID